MPIQMNPMPIPMDDERSHRPILVMRPSGSVRQSTPHLEHIEQLEAIGWIWVDDLVAPPRTARTVGPIRLDEARSGSVREWRIVDGWIKHAYVGTEGSAHAEVPATPDDFARICTTDWLVQVIDTLTQVADQLGIPTNKES